MFAVAYFQMWKLSTFSSEVSCGIAYNTIPYSSENK
jgi:hypothetical protein